MDLRRLAGLVAGVALIVAIVAILMLPAPDTGGPAKAKRKPAAPRPAAAQVEAEASDEADAEAEVDADLEPAVAATAPVPARRFASAEEAEDFLDRNVTEWLAAVAPEIDPRDVDRTCTPDGLHCTFTGPWPGNDLLARMIRAQATGDATREDLEGVTFSKLRPEEDEAGNRIFVLEAHAPTGRE